MYVPSCAQDLYFNFSSNHNNLHCFSDFYGASYYSTSLEERFYHPAHTQLKPSGIYGHGLGIVGTLLILIGVFGYMIRKRKKSLARLGALKYWLEFHIFLCTLGPIFVLFHTAFKFGELYLSVFGVWLQW